jgi:hypothetical protein
MPMTLFMLCISSCMIMASLLLYVQGKGEVGARAYSEGIIVKMSRMGANMPIFFVQLLEQQFHQSPTFCCPHV